MADNIYDEFFFNKAEIEAELIEFGQKFNIPLEQNLRAIRDRCEFLAEIIEYRFGIFFGKLFPKLEHERKVFPGLAFTPDWTLTTVSETVVAEVIRLNPSQADAKEMAFSDTLMDTIGSIQGDFLVQLEYEYAKVDHDSLDQQELKNRVTSWLADDPNIGHSILINNTITIKMKQKKLGFSEVCAVGPFRSIYFDYRRLAGDNSRLFSKLKYAEAIEEHNLPYLICIHLSFESWFKPSDMYEKLFGRSGVFYGDFPFKEYYPDAQFHTIADGFYYSNEVLKKSVSGIVVYYQGQFTFFPNYYFQNRLSMDSMEALKEYIYKDLKD